MQAKSVPQPGQRPGFRPAATFRGGAPGKFRASFASATNDAAFDITGFSTVNVGVSPVDASGNASNATLSLDNFVSSDPTVLTVAPDPTDPNGAIITFVGDGVATLTATATATEADGVTTEQITGTATVTLTSSGSAVAAGLSFTWGSPQ